MSSGDPVWARFREHNNGTNSIVRRAADISAVKATVGESMKLLIPNIRSQRINGTNDLFGIVCSAREAAKCIQLSS